MKRIHFLPKTRLGKWSVSLIGIFITFILIFYALIEWADQRGGDTFFSNLWLTIPILTAATAGISAFVTGVVSIIKKKERSILVYLSILIGLFVIVFISGEIFTPH